MSDFIYLADEVGVIDDSWYQDGLIRKDKIPALCAHLLSLAETPIGNGTERPYTVYAIVKVSGYGKVRNRVGTILKMASEVALQFKNATIHWRGITEVDPEADIDVVMEQTL